MAMGDREAPGIRGTVASVEGYLALAFLVVPFFTPRVDHPSKDMAIVGVIWWGVAAGLAVGGARLGRGGGRLAGMVALGVLALGLLVVVAASVARRELIVWYWRG